VTASFLITNEPVGVGYICLGNGGCPMSGFSTGGGGTVKPRISGILPNWGKVGTNVGVTISGSGFGTTPPPTVSFGGTGITVTYTTRSDTTITGTFTIAAGAPFGNQDVKVINNAANAPSDPVSFQVTPTSSCAVPVNFRQTSESNLPNGTLHFTYQFESSTGNTNDLTACTTGESVFYPGTQNPYVWPRPPMVQQTPNPTVLSAPGNNAFSPDNNGPPSSYVTPYVFAHFQATQRFWWECPCYNSGNLQQFMPDIIIDRKVFQDTGGIWKYQINKSGYTNTVPLP
jgi:hypothetical protein